MTLHVRTTQKSFVDGSIPSLGFTRGSPSGGVELSLVPSRARELDTSASLLPVWVGGLRAWILGPLSPHPGLIYTGRPIPAYFAARATCGKGQGRRVGTSKREMVHEGVMQARVSECVSWIPGCGPPRGTVHDEGPRRLGTSQGALSWSEVNTTVPVLLTENKNDRQESAGPPTCTATKRIRGKRTWGPDGRPCWPCTVL